MALDDFGRGDLGFQVFAIFQLLLQVAVELLDNDDLVDHALHFEEARRPELGILVAQLGSPPFLESLHCLQLHLVNDEIMFALEKVGDGHHNEFVDVDGEGRIHVLNLLNDFLLALQVSALSQDLQLAVAQLLNLRLEALLA